MRVDYAECLELSSRHAWLFLITLPSILTPVHLIFRLVTLIDVDRVI